MPDAENIIFQTALKLSEKTLAAAQRATNEAEFRIPFQAAIAEAAQAIGAPISVSRDEVSLIEGRADTVYNRLVIEYERPGFLKPTKKQTATISIAIQQVKDYINGLQRRERHKMERYAGVVCDGRFFIFCRYRRETSGTLKHPCPWTFIPVNGFSTTSTALQTDLATTPENLLRDFGRKYLPASRKCVAAFYKTLTTSKNPKINALYQQWARTLQRNLRLRARFSEAGCRKTRSALCSPRWRTRQTTAVQTVLRHP